ncbi:MAG TPA: hypothetical protein VKP88_00510, partial [Candidatus Paceibacterota bacterium]|nr:hypothetical protein [Candidatus Paceibacterota bacterium]
SDDGGATWPDSYIRTVDSSENVGLDTNIDIGMGTLAIAYRDLTNNALKLALSSNQGDSWSTHTLDGSGNVGSEISMEMYGYSVYISYYDSTNDDLKFIKYDTSNTSTVTSTVDSTGNVGTFNCIAYDVNNLNVYVAYYDSTNGSIKLAKSVDEGGNWTSETVLTNIDTGGGKVAISVPSGGEIHLAYRDVDSSSWKNLMYAVTTDNGTSLNTTAPVTIDDSSASIGMSFSRPRFDSSDTIYIAYSDNSNHEVQLAISTNNGSNWTTSVIDQVYQLSYFGISLHWVNNNGDTTLYVSYCNEDGSGDELMFAKSIDGGSTW